MTPKPEFKNIFKIMDYSQNLYLSNFEDEQPGDTYYYSPLNVYQSGIVDVSTGKDLLHSYTYIEVEGKEGGKMHFHV